MKKYYKLIFIGMLLMTFGCNKKESLNNENFNNIKEIEFKNDLSFEINSDVTLEDLISNSNNLKLENLNNKVDTSKLGNVKLVFEYEVGNEKKEQTVEVKIVDTTKPEIEFTKSLTTTAGKKIDLLKNVKATDNSKEKITVKVVGEYNFNKEGTYNLQYVATDSSNNKCEESFTLVVNKAVTSNNNNNNSTETNKPNKDETNNNNNNSTSNNENNSSSNNENNNSVSEEKPVEKPVEDNNSKLEEYLISATHKYKVNYTYGYVKSTTDFLADSKQELLNIFYTSLNEGADKFKFVCNYDNCLNDLKTLTNDGTLEIIADYVHPYNTFTKWSYQSKNNDVTVTIIKKYSESDIAKLENKVNNIMNSTIKSSMSTRDKIKALHDYLVNNTTYVDEKNTAQHTAIGPLLNGKSVCEGYTHAMSIFLNRLNVPNYRISASEIHTWNLVNLDGKWLHLDVTWDDPIYIYNGERKEMLRYDFFLVNSTVIKSQDERGEHNFNKAYYKEA